MIRHALVAVVLLAAAGAGTAWSQSASDARALAALSDKELMKLPAKKVFGSVEEPTENMKSRAIGFYSRGCMSGGKALPVDGPAWQAIHLSRNRYWGQPQMVALVERLATEARHHGHHQ